MESLDYWRLCDELSVYHAALLIAGKDPSTTDGYVESWDIHNRPAGYEAAKTALMNAVRSGRLKATIRHEAWPRGWNEETDEDTRLFEAKVNDSNRIDYIFKIEPDWNATTIQVDDLRDWLKSRGYTSGFFFPMATTAQPDYLSPDTLFYAPKLAAAIRAWEHVTTNQVLLEGKTPKQALEKWLRENASAYGLTKDDGKPNELGISDAAKVANWKMDGGAPKTPNN